MSSQSDIEQAARVGDAHGIGPVLRAKLVQQIGDVILRGLGGGAQLDGDLLVGKPLADQVQNFPLAPGEQSA